VEKGKEKEKEGESGKDADEGVPKEQSPMVEGRPTNDVKHGGVGGTEEAEEGKGTVGAQEGDAKLKNGNGTGREAIRRALDGQWNMKLLAAKNLQRETEMELLAATFQCRVGRGTMKEKEKYKDRLPSVRDTEHLADLRRRGKEDGDDDKGGMGKKCIIS